MSSNANVYAAIEHRYPTDLDSSCIETLEGLTYSWRDHSPCQRLHRELAGIAAS